MIWRRYQSALSSDLPMTPSWETIYTVKDTTTIEKDVRYRNGSTATFRDSAMTNAKSCIAEGNAPYSDTGWDC